MKTYRIECTRIRVNYAAAMLGWKIGDKRELRIPGTDEADALRRAIGVDGHINWTHRVLGEATD